VGHVAVQLAKLQGASVCTTVGSPEKAQFVESLGADRAIFYKETDFVQETLNWTSGEGVDVAFDTVGGATFAQTFPAVRIYGHLVSILSPATDTNWKIARDRNLSISLELMLTPMVQGLVSAQQDQAKILQQCARLIDQGDLKIHLGTTFSLKNAAAAHELLEKGSMMGKIALLIED
jgi:NADPH2:quinone reductase